MGIIGDCCGLIGRFNFVCYCWGYVLSGILSFVLIVGGG